MPILITPLIFTLLTRQRFYSYIAYSPLLIFTLPSFHRLLSSTSLAVTYRRAIAQNLFCIINNRLFYLEPVDISSNHLFRIFVPLFLRRVIFDAMHASPAAGPVGEYKTLYRIKLRFIWHQIRKYIKV